jgi:hypothetical protein
MVPMLCLILQFDERESPCRSREGGMAVSAMICGAVLLLTRIPRQAVRATLAGRECLLEFAA